MNQQSTPFKCHLFVCTNTRENERKSCGDEDSADLKAAIKAEIKNRGWKDIVRVSESGCLGVCEAGPNVMIYPQGIWLSAVSQTDIPAILEMVEKIPEKE